MTRLGHFKPMHVKSPSLAIAAQHAAARKTFVGDVHRCNFASKVETALADLPELRPAMAPLLEPRSMMRKRKSSIGNWQLARQDAVCQRPMTIPGVSLA